MQENISDCPDFVFTIWIANHVGNNLFWAFYTNCKMILSTISFLVASPKFTKIKRLKHLIWFFYTFTYFLPRCEMAVICEWLRARYFIRPLINTFRTKLFSSTKPYLVNPIIAYSPKVPNASFFRRNYMLICARTSEKWTGKL